MSAFPGGLDDFTNHSAGDSLTGVTHATLHSGINDAVEAIEAYLIGGGGSYTFVPAGGDIQAAIDALPAGGGTVILGAGDHTITTKLTLVGQLTLRGMGMATTTILADGCDGLYYDPGVTSWPDDEQYITIEHLGIRGDFTAGKVGVYLASTLRWAMYRVRVERFASHGISLTYTFTNSIRNCLIQDNDGDGIHLGPVVTATTIGDCEIARNNNAGIGMASSGGNWIENIIVSGGAIEGNAICGIDVGDYVAELSVYGVWFENNHVPLTACKDGTGGRTAPTAPVVGYAIRSGVPGNTGMRRLTVIGSYLAQAAGSGGTSYGLGLGPVLSLANISNSYWNVTRPLFMFAGNGGFLHKVRSFANTESSVDTSQPKAGSDTFNGTTGRAVTHSNGIDTSYKVVITPTATLAGRVYVTKTADAFTVFSTDNADAGAFDWVIVEDGT